MASPTAAIAPSASLSASVPLNSETLTGLIFSAAWDAAALSFDVSDDGATWAPLYRLNADGTVTEVIVAAASIPTNAVRAVSVDPADFARWPFLRLVSGLHASPVNQTAARTIILVVGAV